MLTQLAEEWHSCEPSVHSSMSKKEGIRRYNCGNWTGKVIAIELALILEKKNSQLP